MSNSLVVTIFCISLSLISISFSSNLLLSKKVLDKISIKSERFQSNLEIMKSIKPVTDIKQLFKVTNSEKLTIKIKDISSKINLNFVDFTLFKNKSFKAMLREQYNWISLQEHRDLIGFTNNINSYRLFFIDELDFESLFTVYGLLNINNVSDIMLEKLYIYHTDNSSKASSLKKMIDEKRDEHVVINNNNFTTLLHGYDESILKYISLIPSWNINNVDEKLLKAILSKYNINSKTVINKRNNYEITNSDLSSLFNIDDNNKSLMSYLGTKTTFWQIEIEDKIEKLRTTLVMGWDTKSENYRVISIFKELL